jgi:acetoin utilization protein AcuB
MHRIPVRQIMTDTVVTIHPDELVADAAQLLEEFDLRRLPVVDDDGYLVGIVTDSDILQAEAAGSALRTYEPEAEAGWLAVADIMTRDVVTIAADATVGALAALMIERKVGGVPVVAADEHAPRRQQLVGIVTETDIFRMIAHAWEAQLEHQAQESPTTQAAS